MSARRIDKAVGLAVLALAIFLALVPLFLGSASDAVTGSVASTGEHGRRALFLVLGELGFSPEAWSEPPGRLPHGAQLLWLAAAPREWSERQPKQRSPFGSGERSHDSERKTTRDSREERVRPDANEKRDEPAPSSEERASANEVPAALRMHALSYYRRFVEDGGELILRYDERAQQFLCDELGLEDFRDLLLDKSSPAGVRRVRIESGEELDVDWPKGACLLRPNPNGPIEPLWTAANSDGGSEEILAVSARVGGGEIVLLGDDGFLDNARLREHDHALLAVRLAEEANRGARLLFDEYALGLWQPQTAGGLAASPQLFLITAHLVLLALFFTWAAAWTRTFPRDPPALARVSPLARARARAALLERAGRYDRLAAMLREGSLRRWSALTRERGERAASSADLRREDGAGSGADVRREDGAGSSSDAKREDGAGPSSDARGEQRAESASDPVRLDLERLGARIGTRESVERWHEAFVKRRVSNARELAALARDLDAIDAEIVEFERRVASRAG